MSNNLPNLYMPYEILGDSRLSLRQIRVLMAIFSWRKGNTNLARISRDMISKRTGYPLTRVSNITTQLEKLGWIEKKGNGGKSQWCQYKVKELRDYKDKNSNGDQNGNHDQNGNETVTDSVSQTVTDSGTGIDTGINTVKEQSKKIYKKNDLSNKKDIYTQRQIDEIENFKPNKASSDRLKLVDGCESLNDKELELLVSDFRDRMKERKSNWKDIQAQFRSYVCNGWVKPKKLKKGTVGGKSSVNKQLLAMKIEQGKQRALE